MKRIWSIPLKNSRGFTLIEVMIVMGIIVFLVSMFLVPDQSRKNRQIKSLIRELAGKSKEIHSYAKLEGVTYRLVLDLKSGKDSETPHQYWVEKTDKKILFEDSEDKKKQKVDEEGNPIDPYGFQPDRKLIKSPKSLPSGLYFDDVEMATKKDPIKEGVAYIHFLPEGLVEETAIHIKYNDKLEWTLAIHPLTGKGDVVPEKVSLKDIRER